jgi:hypothetical protein
MLALVVDAGAAALVSADVQADRSPASTIAAAPVCVLMSMEISFAERVALSIHQKRR